MFYSKGTGAENAKKKKEHCYYLDIRMYMKALQKKSYNNTEANASAQLLSTDRILLSALNIFQSF